MGQTIQLKMEKAKGKQCGIVGKSVTCLANIVVCCMQRVV